VIIKIGKGSKWKEVKMKTGKMAKGYKGNTPADSTYVEEMKNFLMGLLKNHQLNTHLMMNLKFSKYLMP